MKYELKALTFAEILGHSLVIYFDNFIPIFLISVISFLPAIIFLIVVGPLSFLNSKLLETIAALLNYICANILCSALTIELISKKYLKQPQTVKQYISNILPRLFQVFLLAILLVLMVGGPSYLLQDAGSNRGALSIIFIPLLYLFISSLLSAQVLIVEQKGVIESIRRSFSLTKGYKWRILGFLLLIGALNTFAIKWFMPEIVVPFIRDLSLFPHTKVFLLFSFFYLVQIIITPIAACIIILIYFNQRINKEGYDLEHLVNQFDTSEPERLEP